jgi:hypothetical protein
VNTRIEQRWPGARESGASDLRPKVRKTHLLDHPFVLLDPFVLGDHASISLDAEGDDLELPIRNRRSCS